MSQMLIILSFIVIAHASQLHYVADPVEPGSTALIYGSGLANMTLTACAIGGASGGCASWPSVQSWDASLKATVPANSEAAVYSISVNDSQTLFLNAPTYQWHVGVGEVPGSAAPGTTLRVFGANLAWNLGARNCPTLGMGASNSTPAPPLPGVAALLINNDGPQAEGLTTYYSDVTQSHYLSAGCQGCSGSENYQPLRVEGYAFPSPCGETACVELLTYYSQASGTNLVVPAGWGPIPEGFSLWNGNVAYILPVNYSGPSATVSLELWKGVAVAGGAPDYWTLSSSASRAEASAKGYTQVGGELGKLLLSPGGGISPTSKQYSLPVLLASCYRLDLELPSSLPPGAYSLFVNNGLWRDWAPPSLASLPPPLISSLSVLSPPTWPSTLFTVGVTPGCENVTTCLDTASIAGGGEVLLPPGIYQMPSRQALVLGPRVALLGSGQGDGGSALVWSSNTGGGPIGAGGFITGGPSPWRIANLLVVFQSGMWGQPGVLIPAGSVGARVENVTVFINTTDRSATGSGITVGEGGNSTQASQWIVTGSTFYQAPGVSCPINAWPRSCTFYIIAADHGVFSNNTVIAGCQSWSVVNAKNLFMSDLYVQSIGQNSDGNGFGNFYYPQVLENIYVGNTYNVGNWLSTERWETMTFDGLGMVWNSNISSAIGTTLYLPGDPIRNGYDYTGQMVAVLGGPGMGQIRRVKTWSRGPGGQSTWNLDSPWTTPLDHTTIVAILGYRGSITFESNTYLNGTNFQFYGTATFVRVAGNVFQNMNVTGSQVDAECAVCEGNGGVLLGWGKGYGNNAYQPGLYFQAVNNTLTCSTKLTSTACGLGALPLGQNALTYGVIHRGNLLLGTDHQIGFAGGWKDGAPDPLGRGCMCWGGNNTNQPTWDMILENNAMGPAVCYGESRPPGLFLYNQSSTAHVYVPPQELRGAVLASSGWTPADSLASITAN